MKPFSLPLSLAAAGLLLLLAGCSTPETRIREQPALFATLSAEDQATVKAGKVSVGFTPDVVKLALGDPDRVWTRTDAGGTNEVWSYTNYETDEGVYLFRGYYHRYHRFYDPRIPYYATVTQRREVEEIRLQFHDGRVAVIEQQARK